MDMNFKKWLNENATSTADVAVFARPMIGMVRRAWLNCEEDPYFKKRKKHKREGLLISKILL